MATVLSPPMPKKNPRPASSVNEGDKTTTKVYVRLIRRARMISDHRGIDLFEYIDSLLSGPIDRDYRQLIENEAEKLSD